MSMKQPIFILGTHKSGTSLLRSLFDGHPDLFAVPIEVHFFKRIEDWVTYPLMFTRPAKISIDKFIENTLQHIRYCNTVENPQTDGISKDIFDVPKFENYMRSNLAELSDLETNLASCFAIYMKAIYYSIYGTELEGTKRVVEKSVGLAEFALDLQQMFPDSVFIHIARNPYSNIVSMRKYRMNFTKNNFYPWLGYDYRSLYNSFYFLKRNQRLIRNYKVIRYEDLVTDPISTIKLICEFSNLPFLDSMLSPTYLQKDWQGNSTTAEQFKSISPSRLQGWQDDITPLEAKLINKHLKHVLDEFGYELFEPSGSVFVPSPRELPRKYLANRFLLAAG
jgi:protein-tyrosine sulfotransferase